MYKLFHKLIHRLILFIHCAKIYSNTDDFYCFVVFIAQSDLSHKTIQTIVKGSFSTFWPQYVISVHRVEKLQVMNQFTPQCFTKLNFTITTKERESAQECRVTKTKREMAERTWYK